ncbi:MAG TPA: L,D-transpeptidase family protein [Candidatus Cybelea sp.]|nr:L,D-transpeptidase family protein [Candidatus Cybelea sp.]
MAIAALVSCVLLLATGEPSGAAARNAAPAATASEIERLLTQRSSGVVQGEPVAVEALRQLYARIEFAPIWQQVPGGADPGRKLQALLEGAVDHGLTDAGLHLRVLSRSAPATTVPSEAERDLLLSDAYLRLARMLRLGALSAQTLGPDWDIAPDPFDPADALIGARRQGDIAAWLDLLAPAEPQYARLVDAFRRYRAIAQAGGWPTIGNGPELKLGGNDPRLPALRQRLAAEGDLASAGGNLAAALRRFQDRHGLAPDGRIGRNTLTELDTTAEQRMAQIAVNLERWRHLPRRLGDTYIAVNVAAASLEAVERDVAAFHTRTIVGDVRHPTPVFAASVTGLTLNPPWNVPMSIAEKEILPKLRRDPHYLAANDIVIVNRGNDDRFGLDVDWRHKTARDFHFVLRQEPGPKNPLGVIKLEMPNRFDVYLHDTPVKTLFARERRGFSHGCVRVEQVGDLAVYLLRESPTWNREALADAIKLGTTQRIDLPHPVKVYVLYWTAFVDSEDRVNFRYDLYGRDAPLESALGILDTGRVAADPRSLTDGGCPEPKRAG